MAIADERALHAAGALQVLFLVLGVPLAAWVATSMAFAQDLETRAYPNTPVGIKLYASKAAATRIGGDFDLVRVVLQYRWGGGL